MPATPAPAITPIPDFPSLADRATYNAKAYAWATALDNVTAPELAALGANVYGNAVDAQTSAVTATTQAGLATTNGAAQVALATTQAGLATTNGAAQVALATTQAGNALTSANNADLSEAAALASANAAGISAAASEASRIAASKLNLGNKTSAPTLDNQGAALLAGATYYDTALSKWRVWTGAAWGDGISAIAGVSSVNGKTGNVTLASISLSGSTAIYVTQVIPYTITNYNSFSEYFVQVSAGSVSITGDTISFTAPAVAQVVTLTVTVDGVPTAFALNVQAAGVATPTNASPANGAVDQSGTVTLSSSAFAWLGLADTHLNSDWQLATDAGFVTVVQSTSADAVNKTGWTVSGLVVSQTYYWRVLHRGNANGASAWSTGTSFATKATFDGLIGAAGGQGFGVSTYDGTLPSGFSALTGTTDKASANYGNYQFSDGSIMVFVPRFYYRIGNAASPRFATYGANAIDVVGIDAYATEALANAAGYAMHRAFTDGGAAKSGFFLDKYLASKTGTTSCKSVALGNPISLTTNLDYNPSNGMTGCTGILADSVVLARSRGAGVFNVASIFMIDAVAKLSLAHAQASTAATFCAWYDAAGTTNFPKGCNNNALADTNDATVTFTMATTVVSGKPLTGSASNLAKTTHNGQACGVTDVNGAIYQVMLGLTQAGASATDTVANTTGTAFVLKPSVALASLTGGFGAATDAWGTGANLATSYDSIAGFLPWVATVGWNYFGNGTNQVFSGVTSGTDYLRSCCGIAALTGMSATGTGQFGSDGNYQYGVANLFPMASGRWVDAGVAGAFFRYWVYFRSVGSHYVGFRASAYGN